MLRPIACALAGLMALALPTGQCAAIIIRHDVNRAPYVALGDRYRETIVALGLRAQADNAPMLYSGMGTLIGPDWVLTAAHAAAYLREKAGDRLQDHYVYVKGRGYRVRDVIIHPGWSSGTSADDIALIRLAEDVRESHPACLYEGQTEQGQIATLAGMGYLGDGLTGPRPSDGALLGATVHIDTASEKEISWEFRRPGDPLVTALHGISGPGDSGGPAFLTENGRECIAGVSSYQTIQVADNAPPVPEGTDPQGRYGAVEHYMRVSAYLPWIRQTMAGAASR